MNEERSTGVFGSVGATLQGNYGDSKSIELKKIPEESPETIYNLIFKEYDEEKGE